MHTAVLRVGDPLSSPVSRTLDSGNQTLKRVWQANGQNAIIIRDKYDPNVLAIEARQGGFLSGGMQEVAIVQRADKDKASPTSW